MNALSFHGDAPPDREAWALYLSAGGVQRMDERYLSCGVFPSYDGEPANPPANPPGTPPANPPVAPPGFVSQEKMNSVLANEKHLNQMRIEAVQKTLAETLESKNLTAREREQLSEQLEALMAEKRTAEQQRDHDRKQLEKQYETKLKEEQRRPASGGKRATRNRRSTGS